MTIGPLSDLGGIVKAPEGRVLLEIAAVVVGLALIIIAHTVPGLSHTSMMVMQWGGVGIGSGGVLGAALETLYRANRAELEEVDEE